MKKHKGMPGDFKIIGGVIALLTLAYIIQLIFVPGPSSPTALAVAETPVADVIPATNVDSAAPISIISPAKGTLQSPGFSLQIRISDKAVTCYYRTDDNGQLTWDRRMKPCMLDLAITPAYCNTKGANTCKVYVEAADANNNILGSDIAYYGLQ